MAQSLERRGSYEDLFSGIERERLRLRELASRGTYGGEQYLIVTSDFAKRFDDEALIRSAAELKSLSPTEARNAARNLEVELELRRAASDKRANVIANGRFGLRRRHLQRQYLSR